MNPFSTLRLRIRLALMALLAVVPALGVIVYLQAIERAVTVADVARLLRQQFWLLGLVALAVIGAAVLGGELFVIRPVKTLRNVTNRLAAGDFTVRAQLAIGVPGLRELGDAVDSMAVALKARQRERDQSEHRLRASEDRYRHLFDQNPHPIWLYDPETLAVLAVNNAAVDQYGYSRDEFLTLTIKDLHAQEDWQALEARPARGVGQYRGTWRHRSKDGRLVDVEVRENLVRWGERPARLALVDDITERTQLEAQLRQAHKMEAVGQLAGGVAHDFNNLLTVIHGYAELLAASLPEADPHRADVDQIARAAERAASLTRQLLAFSRKQILAPRVLRLGDVVAALAPMLRRVISETIDLQTITTDGGQVKVDAGQLEQVLMNLAVNARDAMPTGGRLTIETADVSLDEHHARHHPSARPGPHVVLAVSDTGHGMDAPTQARVFEPFFTTKPPGQGTGLGLATVYGIVKQSGGHIWVYSEVGLGSTFKVYLPRTDEPAQAIQARPVAVSNLRGTETVLLIEDEDMVRNFVEKVLSRHGYTVHASADPARAIEFARNHRATIHLILSDVVLPGMNGRMLATELLREHPESKVLYISGYTDNAIVPHGVLGVGTWFVQKPFTAQALAQKIREILDSSIAPI